MKYEAIIRVYDRDEIDGEAVLGLNDYISESGFIGNTLEAVTNQAIKHAMRELADETELVIDIFRLDPNHESWCVKHITLTQ